MKKRVTLYFGSFNPVHNGHIALAEHVVEQDLCDEIVLIVSPQNPFKMVADLAPEMARFEMAEMACAASKYPERIKASSVEFLLLKPSYTINTLRFLEEQCGTEMEFSILMGADQMAGIDKWREWEKVMEYPVYLYPREGYNAEIHSDRIRLYLKDAPRHDISSTKVRAAIRAAGDISQMIHPSVAEYIRKYSLWSPNDALNEFELKIALEPDNVALYLERGALYYRLQRWGDALNDFNRAAQIDPECKEAEQYKKMILGILEFRHKDTYNP